MKQNPMETEFISWQLPAPLSQSLYRFMWMMIKKWIKRNEDEYRQVIKTLKVKIQELSKCVSEPSPHERLELVQNGIDDYQ